MPYSDYRAPGIDVIIERNPVQQRSPETQFYPVFIGKGITSRSRTITKSNLRADTSNFPQVEITFDLMGDVNVDLFAETNFTLGNVVVTRTIGTPTTIILAPTTGYTIVQNISFSTTDSTASIILNVVGSSVTAADTVYEVNITASNTDRDYDLRLVGAEDRFFSKDLFGPVVLKENDAEFFNDIAIAAEIAFRMQVPRFYYLEVPRDYGEEPTVSDFTSAIEKVYFDNDAYRIIPLSSNSEVIAAVNEFISGISNPIDRRETVGFVSYDMSDVTDINDLEELVAKVGGFSESLNNKRICNVFAGRSAEMRINNQVYVLPEYFFPVAVASLDAVVGKVDPLSLREITVFEKIEGPRFRPRQWDMLAKKGVLIIQKDTDTAPAVIRHQLTTAQSDLPEDQEYSVVKNFDVVTKKIRDRFKPYVGQYNIDAGYTERLEGTLATVRQEILDEKLAKGLTVITAWSQKTGADGRNLVTRLRLDPVFPANNLDIFLIV